MPISLLIALLIAFGMDLPGLDVSGASVPLRLLETAGGVVLIALLAFGLGGWVASRISHFGYASSKVCRRYTQGTRILTVAGLGIYAWILYRVGWSNLVLSTWGLQGLILVDDLAVLFPYVLIQLAALGLLVLMASPLFIRLAWPTRSLPEGPLRQRLERVAKRVGFRFNDLLVWDTGHMMVNACVTGVLPGFRYVLLSDALIDTLSPVEIAAVFGHEVGHVAHRHLSFFGFFFLGSLGVLALIARVCSVPESWIAAVPWVPAGQLSNLSEMVEAAAILGCLGIFFWLVFGQLSRRFERQADVFGCKVVSCGAGECPPHLDLEEVADGPESRDRSVPALCPVGVQIFCEALASVARQNGIDVGTRSWRHGSIAHRLAFLERLQANPAGEPRFQRGIFSFRVALSVFLLAALVLAIVTGSWEFLH